jgi:hypothetical protein
MVHVYRQFYRYESDNFQPQVARSCVSIAGFLLADPQAGGRMFLVPVILLTLLAGAWAQSCTFQPGAEGQMELDVRP